MNNLQGNSIAAGLALGAGWVEGAQIERRHNELLAAMQANQVTAQKLAYIDEMELACREAERLFYIQFRGNQKKEVKIARLEQMLKSERDLNSYRAEVILALHGMLTDHEKSSNKLLEYKTHLIELKEQLIARCAELLQVSEQTNKAMSDRSEAASDLIENLRQQIANLKAQIQIMDRRHDRLVKLHANAEMRARTWADQLEIIQAQRDVYYGRLADIENGKKVAVVTAPADAPQLEHSHAAPPAPRF